MANAPMSGPMRTGAGVMMGTTTGAIHVHCVRRTRHRIASHEVVRISTAGLLKVCTPIYRNDSDGRSSRLASMVL